MTHDEVAEVLALEHFMETRMGNDTAASADAYEPRDQIAPRSDLSFFMNRQADLLEQQMDDVAAKVMREGARAIEYLAATFVEEGMRARKLERQRNELAEALRPIAAAYPNDPGTSDLDNEQPVTITLGDVRKVWAALARLK